MKKSILFLCVLGGILFTEAADLSGTWYYRSLGADQTNGISLSTDSGTMSIPSGDSYSINGTSEPDSESWSESGTVSDLGDGLVRIWGSDTEGAWDDHLSMNNSADFIYSIEVDRNLVEVSASALVKRPGSSSVADLAGEWRYSSMWADAGGAWWDKGSLAVQSSGGFAGAFVASDGGKETVSGTLVQKGTGLYLPQGDDGVFMALNASKDIIIRSNYSPEDEDYGVEILLKKGTNYQLSDLVGKWRIASLTIDSSANRPASGNWSVVTVGSDGSFSGIWRGWDGSAEPVSGNMSIAADGTVMGTGSDGDSFEFFLNAGKDTMANCYTGDNGDLALDIAVKGAETDSTVAWVEDGRLINARNQFAGGLIGRKIYAFGGNESETGNNLRSIEVYDAAENVPQYGMDHPSLYVEEMTGAEYDGDFYAFGAWGYADGDWDSYNRNVNLKYDPILASWTTLADRPDICSAGGCALTYGDEIYVFGGSEADTDAWSPSTKVHAYNPATDRWRYVTDIPVSVRMFGLARVGNLAYLIGGYNSDADQVLSAVMTYNLNTGVWNQNTGISLPSPARVFTYQHALPSINGTIYCVGGDVAEYEQTDQVDVYDTVSGTWSDGPDLPVATGGHCVLQSGGSIYVVGGATSYDPVQDEDLCTDAVWRWDAGGLSLLNPFADSDPTDRSLLNAAAQEFQSRVDADPTDYAARVYNAFAKMVNLINDPELLAVIEQFGFSVPTLLTNVNITVSLDTMPLSDAALDQICSEVLPVMNSAFNDLDAIPTSWTGTAEISSVYFPLDETVYVDAGDVVVCKAMLKAFSSFLKTLQAYQMDINYNRLIFPVDSPFKSITVDGQTNDWAGVAPQLIGGGDEPIRSVRTAYDATSVYLMFENSSLASADWFWTDGELCVGLGSDVHWEYSTQGTSNVSWSATEPVPGNSEIAFANGIFEARFEIPAGVVVTNVSADYVWTEWSTGYVWDCSELESPDYVPVNTLLDGQSGLLASVQSSALMIAASNDLRTAVGYLRQADSLIVNRTDRSLHFVEYDVSYTNDRAQFFAGLDDFETSLNQPVDIVPSDYDPSQANFTGETVHLGAFYQSSYLTRAMLPQFKDNALLGDAPIVNSYPDPTFGGIFPDMSQSRIKQMFYGADGMDLDEDDLPDWWERKNFGGNVNPGADPDGDGSNNLREYIFGTNPRSQADAKVFSVFLQNGDISIDLSSLEKRWYTIEATDDLTTSNWVAVGQFFGNGTNMVWPDPDADMFNSQYYRIKAQILDADSGTTD